MMKFELKIDCGDVFINGEFVSQLCWNAESVGYAISNYLIENDLYPSCENPED